MYLEKIEIFGFKSFADKTVLNFNKPITSIVGPNGCGKSNVVDAFRWVLGEGSAKSLRSDKMVDVIFSGSAKRKALNYAQISLTFSKVKNSLSLGFDELCISRRIHRNGESEWLINRNPVRLKDVHKVLWEAGMGKNAFYIFEQGKVDQLITSTPLERRAIFEEAAKIMLFKEKKRESLRKLTHVEENLKRVFDIQQEVEKQIEKLSKQAEEAKIYTENKNKLADLEEGLFLAKWKHVHKKRDKELEKQAENKEQQKEQGVALTALENKLEELKSSHESLTVETRKTYELFFEEKKAKELASFESNIHQKKIVEHTEHIESLKQQLKQTHQNHLLEQKTFEENEIQLQEEKKEMTSLSSSLETINDSLLSLEELVEKESGARKELQQSLMQLVQEENKAQAECKRLHSNIEHHEEKLSEVQTLEKNYQEELLEVQQQNKEQDASLLSLKSEFSEAEKTYSAAEQELDQQKESLEILQEKQQKLLEELSQTKASKELLSQLKNEMEGYSASTKQLLEASQNESHPLFEKIFLLTHWFKPKKDYQQKVSTILQPYLQTLVVNTHSDLKLLFETVKKEELSSFSCLCLEDLSTPPEKAQLNLAELNPVSWHFLSHLQTENTSSPTSIQGDYYLDHLGVYHLTAKDEQNVFLRTLELEEKEKQFGDLQRKNEKLSEEITSSKTKIQELSQDLKDKRSSLKTLEIQIHRLEDSKERAGHQKESLSEKIKKYQHQKLELKASLKELLNNQKDSKAFLSTAEQNRAKQQEKFSEIESQFEKNFSTVKEKRGLKQSLEERIKKTEKRSQSLKESIRIFESKSDHFEEQVQKISRLIEEKEEALKNLQQQSQELDQKKEEKDKQARAAESIYKANEAKLEEAEKEQKVLEQQLKKVRTAFNELKNTEISIASRLSEQQAQILILKEELEDKFAWTLEELETLEPDPSITLGQTEKEIRKLRNKLADQPEVNLKALSECEAEKSRFEFLQNQMDDLKVSQDELLKIITELDDSSRRKFQHTFEQIRERFKTNFNLLFNGGEADLQLAAHEDLLEAGIEIIAQPPGKKMRSIQLLSGGEKCLCAIALLFALFETQSIPFCILDEIDAPLDDTNIERFTNVLKKFVENHQFVIITHNKRTMAISDQLLGISMQEKGVTQVLPLKFEHKPEHEEVLT